MYFSLELSTFQTITFKGEFMPHIYESWILYVEFSPQNIDLKIHLFGLFQGTSIFPFFFFFLFLFPFFTFLGMSFLLKQNSFNAYFIFQELSGVNQLEVDRFVSL